MRTLHCRVAGVTYENRQAHLARLNGDEPVRLIPEPQNEYDPNAIAVHIAVPISLDRQANDPNGLSHVTPETEILHCGFIPRELAKDIAPLLEGESVDCIIEAVTGGFLLESGDTAAYGLRLIVMLPDPDDLAYINDYRDKPFQ